MRKYSMELIKEFDPIRQWAYLRGLYKTGDVKTQLVKLQEEVGELAKAILEDNRHDVVDAIGDCVIVLTNLASLAEQHFCSRCPNKHEMGSIVDNQISRLKCEDCRKLSIEHCINKSFDMIRNRTGKMNNGTFVKDRRHDSI